MKKILVAMFLLGVLSVSGKAAIITYDQTLGSASNSVSTTTYSINMYSFNVDYLSLQVSYSTDTYTDIGNFYTPASISTVTSTISGTNNYVAGLAVWYNCVGSTQTVSLVSGTTYFVASPTVSSIKLATTKTNALSGTTISFVEVSTSLVTGSSYTIKACQVAAANPHTIALYASNDNTNWTQFPIAVSSITAYSTSGASNYLFDLGFITYRHIKAVFTPGYWGSLTYKIRGYGKAIAQ